MQGIIVYKRLGGQILYKKAIIDNFGLKSEDRNSERVATLIYAAYSQTHEFEVPAQLHTVTMAGSRILFREDSHIILAVIFSCTLSESLCDLYTTGMHEMCSKQGEAFRGFTKQVASFSFSFLKEFIVEMASIAYLSRLSQETVTAPAPAPPQSSGRGIRRQRNVNQIETQQSRAPPVLRRLLSCFDAETVTAAEFVVNPCDRVYSDDQLKSFNTLVTENPCLSSERHVTTAVYGLNELIIHAIIHSNAWMFVFTPHTPITPDELNSVVSDVLEFSQFCYNAGIRS
ncbi:hypothetical protein PCE1_003437 [Barthelona sp. PCE]